MVVDPDFSPLCSNHPVNTDILYASPLRHFPSRSVCSSWVILGTRITFPTTVLAVASLNYIQTQTLLLSIRTAGAWHASRLLNNVSSHALQVQYFWHPPVSFLLPLLFRLINGTMIHQAPNPATQEPSATPLFPLPWVSISVHLRPWGKGRVLFFSHDEKSARK